jgi:hypothetical protein
MPRLADYVVLSDSSFAIQTGGDIDRSFNVNLEADAHLASRAILSFMLAAQNGANSPQLLIEVNGAQQLNGTLQDGPFVTVLHELVNQNVLQVNNNNIRFAIVGGAGTLNISDVILHYRRNIP